MPINTKESYIEIGADFNDDGTFKNGLKLPAPVDLPATNEFLVDAWRNANGSAVIQQVGRTQYKTEIKCCTYEYKYASDYTEDVHSCFFKWTFSDVVKTSFTVE